MMNVTTRPARTPRRLDALSRERIVAAAIEILDRDGEQALTARALTGALSTGRGAIYHHISGMDDLLACAADEVVRPATEHTSKDDDPSSALRALALGLFDAINTHPWVGTQLARGPFQPAVLRIWTGIGTGLRGLGPDGPTASDAGAALSSYIFGAAAQYAAGARRARDSAERQHFLDTLATAWQEHDATDIVDDAAAQLREHDDRAQFLAGIDIFLRGITTPR